jgi:hypothetical protein
MAETVSALVEMEIKLQSQLDDATDKNDEARMATYRGMLKRARDHMDNSLS